MNDKKFNYFNTWPVYPEPVEGQNLVCATGSFVPFNARIMILWYHLHNLLTSIFEVDYSSAGYCLKIRVKP